MVHGSRAAARARQVGSAAASVLLVALCLFVLAGPAAAQPVTPAPAADVTAEGAVLWDPIDRRVLWGRDAATPRRMASTTKIMTTLLALEADAIDDTVTVSPTAAGADDEAGAATLGLRAGEQLPMRSLLTGLMMRSGNDAAVAVAEHVAGSEAAFVELMNERAVQLGLTATRFVNASGLTDSADHSSSPRDLARLGQVAMNDPTFAELAGTEQATDPRFGPMVNRNLLLSSYDGATGIKTGYTALAGLCLVASASRDGRALYAVVLDSDDSFSDTSAMLDLGYDRFTVVSIASVTPERYRTADGSVDLRLDGTDLRTVPADATPVVRTTLVPNVDRGIAEGTVVGEVELTIDDQVVRSADLVAAEALPVRSDPQPATTIGRAVQDAARALARSTPQQRVPAEPDRIVRDPGRP